MKVQFGYGTRRGEKVLDLARIKAFPKFLLTTMSTSKSPTTSEEKKLNLNSGDNVIANEDDEPDEWYAVNPSNLPPSKAHSIGINAL
jgi:hypothetical protein